MSAGDGQPDTHAAKAAPKRSPVPIVILVAVGLVIGGLAGWFVARPMLAPPTNNGSTDPQQPEVGAPSHPASPLTVPSDITGGLSVKNCCYVMGVWSNIAVVVIQVRSPSGVNNTHDVLRGVDVTTGELLWTYDKTPDGNTFTLSVTLAGMVAGDRLAVDVHSQGGSAASGGFVGDYLLIMSLTTGDVLNSRLFPLTGSPDGLGPVSFQTYVDGVVVVNRYDESAAVYSGLDDPAYRVDAGCVMTQAYQDTNLDKPLWQVTAVDHPGADAHPNDPRQWAGSTAVLNGQLVLAASWDYVDIKTGVPSHMSLFDGTSMHHYEEFDGTSLNNGDSGGWLLDFIQPSGTVPGAPILSGWDDPTADGPKWTYFFPDAPEHRGFFMFACSSNDIMFVFTRGSSGKDWPLTALRLSDGQDLWSVPNNDISGPCIAVSEGDKEYVAAPTSRTLDFLDATSGNVVESYDVKAASKSTYGDGFSGMYRCGAGLICTVDGARAPSPEIKVSGIAFKDGAASLRWSVTLNKVDATGRYLTDAGLVFLTQPTPGKYAWWIV